MSGRSPTPSGDPIWAVIAGGGTAGHVVPGVAIAKALVEGGHDARTILFVGTEGGIEGRLVPEAGFELVALPGRGIQRRLALENVGALWGLARAMARALVLVRRWRPAVVVALGGYASVPCALAAVVWRVPVVVAEQNAVPGAANRLVARFARACAVSFPETALPRARLTGNPVRGEVLAVDRVRDRLTARAALGLPEDRAVVAVFGGSLGARRINEAAAGALAAWAPRDDLAVRHVVGARDWEEISERVGREGAGEVLYQLVRYEDRMELVLAAADVVVCRAGATSVSELAAVGVAAVLVPLPGAPGDHQTANARFLVGAGGAVLVPDSELDADRLVAEVDKLLSDPARMEEMGRAAARAGRRDAAQRVAEIIEEQAAHG